MSNERPKDLVYRALVPMHYTPRRDNAVMRENLDGSRKWVATCLPVIRVIGPFWSFGFALEQLKDKNTAPDGGGADKSLIAGLRALTEAEAPAANEPLAHVHQPALLVARVTSVLQVDGEAPPFSESRMSLLALRTIDELKVTEEGRLKQIPTGDLPVLDGARPIDAKGAAMTTTILVAPFGDPQPKPGSRANKDTVTRLGPVDGAYLPAMQLVHGHVRIAASPDYMEKARKCLALEEPEHAPNQIVLAPGGFALRGKVRLPWQDVALEGWFEITMAPGRAQAGEGDNPQMRLWRDPDGVGGDESARWAGALAALEDMLRQARAPAHGPRWFELGPNTRLEPENLRWPLAFEQNNALLVRREEGGPLELDGRALAARLADRPLAEGPQAALTIERGARVQQAKGEKDRFTIIAEAEGAPRKATVIASYLYEKALNTDTATEKLSLLTGDGKGTLELAAPMIETAERLRRAMGVRASDKLDALWVFTPLDQGWLHWPLPNATPGNLGSLLPLPEPTTPSCDPRPPDTAGDGVSGALMFNNKPGSPGYKSSRRAWSLTLNDPVDGSFEAVFERKDGSFVLTKVTAKLHEPSISFDGVVPITPFRQTPQRLTPDHAERALATIGLTVVSPSNLLGVEREAWEKSADPKIPRLGVSFEGLAIAPSADGGAALSAEAACWFVRLAKMEKAAPWIWARHDTLPTVQTLPLANAGAERNLPGEARSLAPLVLENPQSFFTYAFAPESLDMRRGTLSLVHKEIGAGPFIRPPALRAEERAWRPEIGMAITTLPSLTLFPGVKGAQGFKTQIRDWAGFPIHEQTALARHDIALRDDLNALAVSPQDTKAIAVLFAPQTNNSPDPDPAVWADLDRKAGLAALDRREMIREEGEKKSLVGVFGEQVFPVEVKLDLKPVKSGAIGAWSLQLNSGSLLTMRGLPASSDLEGASGLFKRDDEKISVRYGTAALYCDKDSVFKDQFGLTLKSARRVKADTHVLRELVSEERLLLTLTKPLPIKDHDGLVFWCADVPIDKRKVEPHDSFLEKYADADNVGGRLNGAGLKQNALAGFRWTLGDAANPCDLVVIDGFVFEPLALTGFVLGTDESIEKITIKGRLRLPVGKAGTLTTPPSGGEATLILTPKDGCLAAELTAKDIVWFLIDPAVASGLAPTLTIPEWPGKGEGVLEYVFAGETHRHPLSLRRQETDDHFLTASVKQQDPRPEGAKGAIVATNLTLAISRAKLDKGTPVLALAHVCALELEASVGRSDARVEAKLTQDLLSDGAAPRIRDISFWGPDKARILVNPEGEEPFDFGFDHFALRWQHFALRIPHGPIVGVRLFGALLIAAGRGAIFATLKGQGGKGGLPRFLVTDVDDAARFELTAGDGYNNVQKLQLVLRRPPDNAEPRYRLHGSITLTNAFSWPVVAVENTADGAFEIAKLSARRDQTITHLTSISFDGDEPVAFGPFEPRKESGYAVSASVRHTFRIGEATALSFATHQLVRFYAKAPFLARLAGVVTPSPREELAKTGTGFSPVAGKAAPPLADYAPVPHFLHLSASGPGGLAGDLAMALAAAIQKDGAPLLAIDMSSHALLVFGDDPRTAQLILASLPAIGFLTDETNTFDWMNSESIRHPFASAVDADALIAQPAADGLPARSTPALDPATAASLSTRLAEARAKRERSDASVATHLLAIDAERLHRPVYQAVVLAKDANSWKAAVKLPGAGTAMHLSALIDAAKKANRAAPLAISFRGSGGLTGDDLFKVAQARISDATSISLADYRAALRLLRERLMHELVPGPDAREAPARREIRIRLVARSRDGEHLRVIAERAETGSPPETVAEVAPEWACKTLGRLAPWTTYGFLFVIVDDEKEMERHVGTLKLAQLVTSARLAGRRPAGGYGAPLSARMAAQRQREIVARPVRATPPRFAGGYQPLAVEPRLLASETDVVFEGETVDHRLTATALAMAWTLEHGPAALLAEGANTHYWVTDRQQIAFRPWEKGVTGAPLTFALPGDWRAQAPAAVTPANHLTSCPRGPTPKNDGYYPPLAFAPSYVSTTMISSRAGAFVATRTGLVEAEEKNRACIEASQAPVLARLPRPPLLARNDRPRASSHEGGSFHLSRHPTVILHGPRAKPVGVSTTPVGLDRSPRSLFATRVALAEPAHGVIGPQWNGVVEIRTDAVFGSGDWTLTDAAIVIGAQRFEWKDGKSVKDKEKNKEEKPFPQIRTSGGKTPLVGFGNGKVNARDVLLAQPPASAAVLEITCEHVDGERKLTRQARFDLLTAGPNLTTPDVEAPLHFRFDDPEYNDKLQGLAKLARENAPNSPDNDFVFAADRSDIRFDQRLELALAIRRSIATAELSKLFDVDEKKRLQYGGESVRLKIERQRPGINAATGLTLAAPSALSGAVADGEYYALCDGVAGVFHAMKLDCSQLLAEGERGPALLVKDRLALSIYVAGAHILTLRFDVVDAPEFPANEAAFAILASRSVESVRTHLYASGPNAAIVELVDPLDLIDGVVRRRAIYQWRSFYPAVELAKEAKTVFALQKINRVGGTWLPARDSDGWLSASN